ncbi:MAG: dihydrofolate reductase [Bacillota bacterium]|nr:dihydrofolate reductase [Bacillota bacterium]
MKAIVAVDENWAIGREGELLVSLPGDLQHFRRVTLGKTVVMGRATLESLPGGKPLKGRRNLVLSSRLEPGEGYEVASSPEELFLLLEAGGPAQEEAFVVGGEQVYRLLLDHCHYIYVTKVEGRFPADKYFPDLDAMPDWECVQEGPWQEENLLRYRFTEYRRKG